MTGIQRELQRPETGERARTLGYVAVGCGALGTAAAVWAYWLVVPAVVLGVAAVVLGVLARRGNARDAGSAAIALGLAAVLLVPSVLVIVDGAEDWGRDCALNPQNPDC